MKTYLAAFDLDNTIVDMVDNEEAEQIFYSDGKVPQIRYDLPSCDEYRQFVNDTLNDRHLTKSQVLSIWDSYYSQTYFVIKGMDQVLKALHQDHDIIVISDSNTFHATHLLKLFGLYQYVSAVFSRPLNLKENGQFVSSDLKSTWKAPCQYGGRNVCKGQVLMDYAGDKYQKILYTGDGSNDFCPSMTLSGNALVMPRKGFTLEKKLKSSNCQAEVKTWNDGYEIISFLQDCGHLHL